MPSSNSGVEFFGTSSLAGFPVFTEGWTGKRARAGLSPHLAGHDNALREWPTHTKRARLAPAAAEDDKIDVGVHDGFHDSLHCNPLGSKYVAPPSLPPSWSPARPRAFGMHIFEDSCPSAGAAESLPKGGTLFSRFAQLAGEAGVVPLRALPSDVFPTLFQMESLVHTIVAA